MPGGSDFTHKSKRNAKWIVAFLVGKSDVFRQDFLQPVRKTCGHIWSDQGHVTLRCRRARVNRFAFLLLLGVVSFYLILWPNFNSPWQIPQFTKGYLAEQDWQKNSGHLWLTYTELRGGFNMLQLISVGSCHFIQPELWQFQVRIWKCSGTTSYPKGSWAVVD